MDEAGHRRKKSEVIERSVTLCQQADIVFSLRYRQTTLWQILLASKVVSKATKYRKQEMGWALKYSAVHLAVEKEVPVAIESGEEAEGTWYHMSTSG